MYKKNMLMVNRLDVYVEIDHPVISWNSVTIWFCVCVCVCVCACVRACVLEIKS